ncbi:putative peptide modification system cyclase [Arenimonas daejeonensis]|uniref:putative peptide modification system cyclase n=1 Tax=Arenimonas daejeonensis TaxID=370777 RepID=UPI001315701F|nr:putative peptide modification system cyclase [Arenimonas daejeonensis]
MNNHAAVTPVLRAVLLCDIVESTALVERLGDVRAVALLRKHDQLLREAMALCHGQLIDKADGVLALFERPIQALDFALRYQRGLHELGESEKLVLQARIGIHVGDVMTWANDPKDVLAGAKAYEVEGLAKPVAARLMNLALPGQILMSGMAQNLCQRAAGELGASGVGLRWLMHGRYSFKGVPAPMLVHEVGLPGLSPLRPPVSGAKAWRELPLWRRPPVLAVEALLLGVLGVALFWSTLRSPPAIAFAERDWVVVAQLQNRTDEKVFDDSLDTALRIGLEQSRHVNLVSQLQIDRALERMQRQGQPVDRQLAAELALREGAKAVILPTVAEVGGVVRVSLEVIDPNSGVTVYSESADGRGIGSVLPSLDATLTKVRSNLGEAMTNVESNNLSLEQATTDNLDALKAFSLGARARNDGRDADAAALYQEAVKLDPEFSMAWLRLAFLRYIENDEVGTRTYLAKAMASREHLSRRELLLWKVPPRRWTTRPGRSSVSGCWPSCIRTITGPDTTMPTSRTSACTGTQRHWRWSVRRMHRRIRVAPPQSTWRQRSNLASTDTTKRSPSSKKSRRWVPSLTAATMSRPTWPSATTPMPTGWRDCRAAMQAPRRRHSKAASSKSPCPWIVADGWRRALPPRNFGRKRSVTGRILRPQGSH